MRKVQDRYVKYVGYSDPKSVSELELEILGLETAITKAQQQISILKQGIKLSELMENSIAEDKDEGPVEKT